MSDKLLKKIIINYQVRDSHNEMVKDVYEDVQLWMDSQGVWIIQGNRQTFFPMNRINWMTVDK